MAVAEITWLNDFKYFVYFNLHRLITYTLYSVEPVYATVELN